MPDIEPLLTTKEIEEAERGERLVTTKQAVQILGHRGLTPELLARIRHSEPSIITKERIVPNGRDKILPNHSGVPKWSIPMLDRFMTAHEMELAGQETIDWNSIPSKQIERIKVRYYKVLQDKVDRVEKKLDYLIGRMYGNDQSKNNPPIF